MPHQSCYCKNIETYSISVNLIAYLHRSYGKVDSKYIIDSSSAIPGGKIAYSLTLGMDEGVLLIFPYKRTWKELTSERGTMRSNMNGSHRGYLSSNFSDTCSTCVIKFRDSNQDHSSVNFNIFGTGSRASGDHAHQSERLLLSERWSTEINPGRSPCEKHPDSTRQKETQQSRHGQ